MSKIYVLQKDLPDAKAGTELRLDGEGDMYDYASIGGDGSWYKRKYVENNPEWFKLKEEPKPTVVTVEERENAFIFGVGIRGDRLLAKSILKNRLAEILIAEGKGELKDLEYYKAEFEANVDKRYTEKELLEAEEKAFNAGRELQNFWFKSFDPKQLQYPTFSDYKNQNK